ncbi:hypothetical protein C8R44DRAFT_627549 [Mycena epipterygia]|nr:hypothetical protein C8R44DRAFT_627549 [Mycena epipterygia]
MYTPNLQYPQQALYYLDPSNMATLWDRATLARDIGDLKTTRIAFLDILACFSHDINIFSNLRTVLLDLGGLQTCSTLFQAVFDYYRNAFPS